MRMRHILLPSVACPALTYFSTLSHKRHDFWEEKKVIDYKMCVDFLYNFRHKTFLFPKRTERDNVKWQVLMRLEFYTQITNEIKFHPFGADRRTDGDMRKLKGAFSNFANAPKNQSVNAV
jgi:hypothetical protein